MKRPATLLRNQAELWRAKAKRLRADVARATASTPSGADVVAAISVHLEHCAKELDWLVDQLEKQGDLS